LRRDAERFQAEKQAEFDKGARRDKPGEITLRAFCDKYLEQRRHEWRETTRGNQEDLVNRLLAHFSGGRPIHSISPEQAHRFWMEATPMRSDLKGKKLSRETRNRILREAKTLFEYAVRWEYLPANPFAGLRQQRVGKKDRKDWCYITPSEYRALLEIAPSLTWKAFYAVSYTAGLRLGETANLMAGNVRLKEGLIHVQGRPATDVLPPFEVKDHETRQVPIPRTTGKILAELLGRTKRSRPFILLTAERNAVVFRRWGEHRLQGLPWVNRCMLNNTLRDFRRHAKWAGIEDPQVLTVHTLRKSCGVNWANHLPTHVTQAYMGHADIKTTQQYYLSVTEEHAERTSWIIEQVTMLGEDTTDAKVTPEPKTDDSRRVG
jgi:integrase